VAVSAALGSCLDLLRRSCNANGKLLKPVRGDSVISHSEGPCGETVLGYAASAVWNVMSRQLNDSARYMQRQANN
jgi:hypothetical protein